ncbi:alpha/beta hydrolase [Flavobacteriaceae bacterium]|nr:alpha/beta hydrolase [Flavobacteriaceae bacterium]
MKKRILKLFLLLLVLSISLYLYSPDISVSELKKTYANQYSQFIEIDGMNVHYRDEGEGLTIVLLHGTGASLHTWDEWTNELKKTFRVIRLDLPAYGLTGPHPEKKYSLSDYSSFLNSFVESLDIDNFILSGNSLGGAIAWYYASEYPNKVELLSLLDPGGLYNKEKQSPLVFRLARAPGINKILRYVTPRFFIKNTLKEVYFDKTKLTDKKIDTYRDLILRENNRESFINRSNSEPVDYTSRLKLITAPTQILWGNEDEWIPVENAKFFSESITNNTVDIMYETGHIPMEERPYESLELFLDFINSNL